MQKSGTLEEKPQRSHINCVYFNKKPKILWRPLQHNPQGKDQRHQHHGQAGAGVQGPGPALPPGAAALLGGGGQHHRLKGGLLGPEGGLRLPGQAVLLEGAALPGQGRLAAVLLQVHHIAGMLNKAGSFVIHGLHICPLRVLMIGWV